MHYLCLLIMLFGSSIHAGDEDLQDVYNSIASFRDHMLIVVDGNGNELASLNKAMLDQLISPCSTYKIPHTLFALDAGVINQDSTFQWDGVERPVRSWNKDQNMQSAMGNSVVWVYQIIARRIGAERMQQYLETLNYGNRDISGGIDQFWLASSLKITPRQQLQIVQELHNRALPFPAEHQEWVERLISQEHLGKPTVFGKTGSGLRDGDSFGWFIGYQEKKDISRYFVLFIRDVDGRKAYGITARDLAFRLLDALD